jgi:hypothetical protein
MIRAARIKKRVIAGGNRMKITATGKRGRSALVLLANSMICRAQADDDEVDDDDVGELLGELEEYLRDHPDAEPEIGSAVRSLQGILGPEVIELQDRGGDPFQRGRGRDRGRRRAPRRAAARLGHAGLRGEEGGVGGPGERMEAPVRNV